MEPKQMPNTRLIRHLAGALACAAGLLASWSTLAVDVDPSLAAAIANPARSAKFVARDAARHPAEELTFLGLKPGLTVVELSPGGGYWTEILAPYLNKGHGRYIAALSPIVKDGEENASTERWLVALATRQPEYGPVGIGWLAPSQVEFAAPGSVDLIVTFRNLHNWMNDGSVERVLAACFTALKPGGILGVEAHRGRADKPQDPKADNGYVREDYAIELIRKAGFRLVAKSELLANPRDTKDYKEGVWTLPPTLTLGDQDRAKYVAIGEADNFLLKFEKPR
jgi:predicted methyltransferase